MRSRPVPCDLSRAELYTPVRTIPEHEDRPIDQLARDIGTDRIEYARHYGFNLCGECMGAGIKGYSDTTTWRGGIGGQAMTSGVCDKCWGSGIHERPGVNLRTLSYVAVALREIPRPIEAGKLAGLVHVIDALLARPER
jgi:hypothetical protein